jgi:hypothetical protein
MKHSDEAIERVLAGLREVETPMGLEGRVLVAMDERAAARSAWRPKMGWVVACGVAGVLVVGVLMVRPSRVAGDKFAGVHAVPVKVEHERKRNTEILRVAQNDLRFRGVRKISRDVAVRAERTDVGGFPAPPMPLTQEEKLLVRVAHRGDATELTPLNAEARARQEAEFDAEFQEFFAAPATVTDEKQVDPTESDKGEAR